MRLRNIFALAALALTLAACGPGGCAQLGPLLDPSRGALSSTAIDEQAVGILKLGAALANKSYALAARSEPPLMTKATDDKLFAMLGTLDVAIKAADDALKLGDAAGYIAKVSAAKAVLDDINRLIPAPKAR